MKRIFTTFSLIAMSLPLLVACNQQQEEAPAPAPREATTAAAPPDALTEGSSVLVFSPYQAPASVAVGGNCALDAIDGHPAAGSVLSADSDATFGGWAATPQGQVPDANSGAVLILSSSEAAYSVPLVAGGDDLTWQLPLTTQHWLSLDSISLQVSMTSSLAITRFLSAFPESLRWLASSTRR